MVINTDLVDIAYNNFAQILSLSEPVSVYAYGGHERLLKRALECSDRYTAFFLSSFVLEKWCLEKRKEIDLDIEELKRYRIYMGVNQKHEPLTVQEQVLVLSTEVAGLIDEIIDDSIDLFNPEEKDALSIVFTGTNESLSRVVLAQGLKSGIGKISLNYGNKFSAFYNQIFDLYLSLENRVKVLYHDSEVLKELYTYSKSTEDEYYYFRIQTEKIIESLKGYPFTDGLYDVCLRLFEGKNTKTIADELDRDFKYAKKRVFECQRVIESFLWGYC